MVYASGFQIMSSIEFFLQIKFYSKDQDLKWLKNIASLVKPGVQCPGCGLLDPLPRIQQLLRTLSAQDKLSPIVSLHNSL